MSDAIVTPLPSRDIPRARAAEGAHTCDDCGRDFPTGAALGGHRKVHRKGQTTAAPDRETLIAKREKRIENRDSGIRKGERPRDIPRDRPRLDADSVRASLDPGDDYDPWVILVGHATDDGPTAEAAIVSTKGDADQVTRLLDTLGVKVWTFRLGDAQRPTTA